MINDSNGLHRCLKTMRELGTPAGFWECAGMYDIENGSAECEMCGRQNVKFVHLMRRDGSAKLKEACGRCAGIMAGNAPVAMERERLMMSRSKRRANFMKRQWQQIEDDYWTMQYKGRTLHMIRLENGHFAVKAGDEMKTKRRRKPLADMHSAKCAAFDLADPMESVCRHA